MYTDRHTQTHRQTFIFDRSLKHPRTTSLCYLVSACSCACWLIADDGLLATSYLLDLTETNFGTCFIDDEAACVLDCQNTVIDFEENYNLTDTDPNVC